MQRKFIVLVSVMILFSMGCASETLKAVSNDGFVKIVAEPSSAEVYVDGYAVGRAKEFNGNPGLLRLTHGTHTIELKKDGYQSYIRRVFVGNEALEPIHIMLIQNQ